MCMLSITSMCFFSASEKWFMHITSANIACVSLLGFLYLHLYVYLCLASLTSCRLFAPLLVIISQGLLKQPLYASLVCSQHSREISKDQNILFQYVAISITTVYMQLSYILSSNRDFLMPTIMLFVKQTSLAPRTFLPFQTRLWSTAMHHQLLKTRKIISFCSS